MYQLSMVSIGAPKGRNFLFSNPLQNQFRTGPALGGLFSSYVSDAEYYKKAKAAVASFDQLNQRVRRIADKAARDKIIKDYSMDGSTLTLRNQVQGAIDQADATGDPGDGFADDGKHGRKPTDALIDFVNDISSDVQDAELTHGILPAPAAPAPAAAPPPAAASPWPYVIAGGGVVAALAIVGVI